MSYLKFGSFEACPLRYHVQYDAARLARTDGKQFRWSDLPHNLDAYLLNPAFTLRRNFPYFFIDGQKHHEYPHAKLDLAEPTLAMPYAMPAMFLLAFGGGVYAFRRMRSLRLPLLLLGLGVVPMATAMLAAVAISHRYTADFCPFLICVAAGGVAAIDAGSFRGKRAAKILSRLWSSFPSASPWQSPCTTKAPWCGAPATKSQEDMLTCASGSMASFTCQDERH